MATFQAPVGISNRHVHLSQEHIEQLFGGGYTLTKMKDLSQPGQYACEETVTLVGPKGTLEGVRVLGPSRKATQVELAITDTFKLGVNPVVRDSGQHEGTSGIELIGPKGTIRLEKGVIVAARHVHMSPDEAAKYGLQDGQRVKAVIAGRRGGILEQVLVRINPDYVLDLHVDTDEGNAFQLKNGQSVNIIAE